MVMFVLMEETVPQKTISNSSEHTCAISVHVLMLSTSHNFYLSSPSLR